ncbi:C-type lectin domain family 6 member A-like [Saccoglossus kowalevskii]
MAGTCFLISDDERGWEDARENCAVIGGDLAVLEKSNVIKRRCSFKKKSYNNERKVHFIRVFDRYFQRGETLWIGLHELAIEGSPHWIDPTIRYRRNKKYPWSDSDGNTIDKDCVVAVPTADNAFKWEYIQCNQTNKYLCEVIGSGKLSIID